MNETSHRLPLANTGILVTRPAQQAETLCRRIEQLGGRALRFPVMSIVPPADPGPLEAVLDRLDSFAWAIFISANAVQHGLAAVGRRRSWPAGLRIAAIGKASAKALREHGLVPDAVPEQGYTSEALLALDDLQRVENRDIVIFRGEGGRETLAETLRARGARVTYANAYRRALPEVARGTLLKPWQRGEIDAVMLSSGEGLENLLELLVVEELQLLRQTPLLVVSERLAERVRELGFAAPPLVAADATDDAVITALVDWNTRRNPG